MPDTLLMGFAQTTITPWFGVELSGYGFYLDRKCDAVHQDVIAQAVAMKGSKGAGVIISADLIGYDYNHVLDLRAEIAERTGIPSDGIIFTATHTHSGPATIFLHGCGTVDEEYKRFLTRRLVDLAHSAQSRLAPVKLYSAEGALPEVAYNRARPDGPVDDILQCLFVEDLCGQLKAVLARFSCHPVVFRNDNTRISGDFVSAFRRALDKQWPGIIPMYLQGACGDLNPDVSTFRGEPATAVEGVGLAVAGGVLGLYGKRQPVRVDSIQTVTQRISLPHADLDHAEVERFAAAISPKGGDRGVGARGRAQFASDVSALFHEAIDSGTVPKVDRLELQGLRIGSLTLLFHGAELFSEPALRLRGEVEGLWIVGYSNDFWGYVPDAADFARKGYAAVTVPYMVHKPPYTPDVAERFVNAALAFLDSLV